MINRPFLDSDVIIDYLRKRSEAMEFVRGLKQRPLISVVTVSELYSGVRDGRERDELDIVVGGFRVIRVTRDIAVRAGLHRRTYRKSHHVQLADALIAASVEEAGAEFFTLNVKHFPMFPNLAPPYQKA